MHTIKTCSVSGCSRTSETPGVAFYNFPRRNPARYHWIRFIEKPIIYDLENYYICSAHFANDAFEDDDREVLKETAVPTLVDEETLNVCFANETYDDENIKRVLLQQDLNNIELKYIKEEDVAYVKEEEVEYMEEPYSEVEVQDEPILTQHDSDDSESYEARDDEVMEISVPNQLINENTMVEINEAAFIDENTEVEIADPNQSMDEDEIVRIKESHNLLKSAKIVKICRVPEKKVIELSHGQFTPVTVTFQLCRFCTKQVETDNIDIFADNEFSAQIRKMLNVVIPGRVKEDDGLPNITCKQCVQKLRQCYNILIVFFNADAYFRNKEFITLPRPSEHKDDDFQSADLEETLDGEHADLNGDLSNAIIIENSEDLEEVIFLNEMENLEDSSSNRFMSSNEEDIIIENTERHSCPICPKTFKSLVSLVLHKYSKHSTGCKGQYSCPKCKMEFSMLQVLKLHIQRKHPSSNKLFMCGECKLGFRHKHSLENHKKSYHRNYICEVCGKAFSSLTFLQDHVDSHDEENVEETDDASKRHLCWICGKAYRLKQNLENHIQIHFGIQTQGYPCLVCGRKLESVAELRVHLETHKEKDKNYKCSKCDRTFLTKSLLQQHILTHPLDKLFICEICGKAFKKASTLNRHKESHIDINNMTDDEYLSKPFKNEADLDIYECSICGKKIVSKLSYKYHLSKHNGSKKPFDCEICGMAFAKVQGYKTHILIHRGEYPFVCDKCGKGFRTKRTLQQHEVVHTDERPFSCNHCPLAFKRMDSLYMHQAVHSGKRPFSCTMCSKTFVRKQDTRTHLIRYHKLHNSEVDSYILKEIESDTIDDANFPFKQEDYFTEYISVENSLEVETS